MVLPSPDVDENDEQCEDPLTLSAGAGGGDSWKSSSSSSPSSRMVGKAGSLGMDGIRS